MYEGLPITTNKLPVEDRRGVPHHLLGCIKLGEEPWTVKEFIKRATGAIEQIRSRHRLPILVGGTHYYTQSLLFSDTIVEEGEKDGVTLEKDAQKLWLLDASTEEISKELWKIDPEMAMRWHPNDRRKLRRSLEIWIETGMKASEVYKQQKIEGFNIEPDGRNKGDIQSGSDVSARSHVRHDFLIFWVHAPSAVLNARLDKRVDDMVSHGLLEEVTSMQRSLREQEQQGGGIDQGRGIWVAIGYKEFLPYILDAGRPERLRQEGIERTKIATRQYAKRQDRWIRLRLQRAVNAADLMRNMFLLDATNSSQWSDKVDAKAQSIVGAFISGSALPEPHSLSDAAEKLLVSSEEEAKCVTHCEACGKTLMFHSQWINHLKSKGHRVSVRPKIDLKKLYLKGNGQ